MICTKWNPVDFLINFDKLARGKPRESEYYTEGDLKKRLFTLFAKKNYIHMDELLDETKASKVKIAKKKYNFLEYDGQMFEGYRRNRRCQSIQT